MASSEVVILESTGDASEMTGLQMVLIPLLRQCCQCKTTLVHCALQPIYFQTRYTLTDTKTCNLAVLPNTIHHLSQISPQIMRNQPKRHSGKRHSGTIFPRAHLSKAACSIIKDIVFPINKEHL